MNFREITGREKMILKPRKIKSVERDYMMTGKCYTFMKQ